MCKCIVVSILFALLGIAVLVIGLVLGFAVFDIVIDDEIREITRLEIGTPQYNRWTEPPHPIFLKVYFFNITNSDLVTINGSKPIVEEIGPYVYRQYRTRFVVNITEDNDILTYTRSKNFQFDSEASGNYNLDDTIRVLNVPLLATLQMFEMHDNLSYFDEHWRAAFDIADDETDPLFHTVSVEQYLFDGYKFCTNLSVQAFCNDLNSLFAHSKMFKATENGIAFSFFDYRNGENGNFEIFSGINQINNLGRIQRWNNQEYMDAWVEESVCNQIRGTDSTIFPPFNDQDSSFDVLYSDICRIFNLVYDKQISFKEIQGNRYTLRAEALSIFSPNRWCHCINITKNLDGENMCLPNGFEDMYGCLGINLVLSFPHLFLADNTYASTVDGLNSSQTRHRSYVELEPQLGIPLTTAKRMQYNMFLRNNTNITQYVTPAVIPILWFEEVMEISQELIDDTINSFLNWTLALEIVTWVLVGVGAAILVISIIGCLCCR
ncbi:Snmp2 [Trypoxylus dichotomus]